MSEPDESPPLPQPDPEPVTALTPLSRPVFRMLWGTWLIANLCMWMNDVAAAWMSAPMLLALTFANGIGLAMRWPVFAAIVPELVPRREVPAAIALNGIAMNASRIFGPLIAGALIAAAGSSWVFLLNAALSIAAGIMIQRWRREQKTSTLPAERFFGAIRVGLQFVRQSPVMHATMLRAALFFLNSTAVLALLPLLAKDMLGGSAGLFTLLLAAMGAGAIVAALFLPRLRGLMTRDEMVRNGTLLHAAATVVVAFAPNAWVATPAMVVVGMAWITVANSLTVAAQMALPDWVRARGMSIHQMAMMGGSAAGAALWGQLAAATQLRTSLVAAAVCGVLAWVVTRHMTVGGRAEEDLTPAGAWREPEVALPIEAGQGPVLITIDYRVEPGQADEFVEVMHESRRIRLRNGALTWGLFRDTADPHRWVEYFLNASWVEYLRQQDRLTASDVALRQRKWAFHVGKHAPVVSRFIAQPIARR